MFPRGVGEGIGITFRLPSQCDRRHRIIGGEWPAQTELVTLTLEPFADLSWEAEVDFLVDDPGPLPYGLLGQEGFLDKWVISFNYYRSYFVVEPIEEFEQRLSPDPYEELQRRFPDPYAP